LKGYPSVLHFSLIITLLGEIGQSVRVNCVVANNKCSSLTNSFKVQTVSLIFVNPGVNTHIFCKSIAKVQQNFTNYFKFHRKEIISM